MTERARVRTEPNPKWIRGTLDGHTVVDSRRSLFVWEIPYYPAWYFPVGDVAGELVANGETVRSPSRGEGTRCDLMVDGRRVSDAAYRHLDSPVEALRDLVRIEWDALDAWFEEDVEVFIHPRSPETRIDTLVSSRHVTVSIDGTVVADSAHPTVLYETGLPPRYYLSKRDVRMELLRPTDSVTGCPYKGWARYWSVALDGDEHTDIAWSYRTPLPESAGVAGLISFYDERVDLDVDGVRQPRPKTKFS